MVTLRVFLTALLVILAGLAPAQSATYYVSPSGSDTNPGTMVEPWQTIAKASSSLRPGDTVCLRVGTYRETIRPASSGSAGRYVTYAAYEEETPIITGGAEQPGADLTDRSYIVLDGLHFDHCHGWVRAESNASRNIIRNCRMTNGSAWGGVRFYSTSSYNQILDNELHGGLDGEPHGSTADAVVIWGNGSHHNLIEGNRIEYSTHQCIDVQGSLFTIVRNNYIYNPWHTGIGVYPWNEWALVENNTVLDCGQDWQHNDDLEKRMYHRKQHGGIQIACKHIIVRRNLVRNAGHAITISSHGDVCPGPPGHSSAGSRLYHNTLMESYDAMRGCYATADVVAKDNIFSGATQHEIDRQYLDDDSAGIAWVRNVIHGRVLYGATDFSPSGTQWTSLEEAYPADFPAGSNNLCADPATPGNVTDAGYFLTATTAAGKGSVVPVVDPLYFCDGWGLIEGDLVQFEGQTQVARIIAVDYANKTLALDRNMTWTSGLGISLPYQGDAPDIGRGERERRADEPVSQPQETEKR